MGKLDDDDDDDDDDNDDDEPLSDYSLFSEWPVWAYSAAAVQRCFCYSLSLFNCLSFMNSDRVSGPLLEKKHNLRFW